MDRVREKQMSRRAALVVALFLLVTMLPLAPARAGGYCHTGGNTQEATTEVDMKGNCFRPTVTHIDVGDKVTWTNWDGENHIILGVGGSWGTPEVKPNGATTMRFDEPGVYPYWCHIHLGMVGAVVVGDGKATAAGGGSGAGPIATLVSAENDAAEATEDSPTGTAAADEAENRSEPAAAEGIDWGALAAAGALVAITALLLFGRKPIMVAIRGG
jgi:plastocyanin